ncbi:MAG: DUF5320 domain-containing protein [Kiritimatiellia bacterium]
MPRGDRTGPMGAGPMTGRAAGFCAGSAAPGFAGFGGGFGRGFGRGCGRGFGRGFGRGWGGPVAGAGTPTGPQELAVLKQQAQQLQTDMELIQGRIQELETKPEKT